MRSFFCAKKRRLLKRFLLILTVTLLLFQTACEYEQDAVDDLLESSPAPSASESVSPSVQPDEPDKTPEQNGLADETGDSTDNSAQTNELDGYVNPLSNYAYNSLSDDEKELYGSIAHTMETMSESRTFGAVNVDVLKSAVAAVKSDHPEYFWVSGYTLRMQSVEDELVSVEYVPEYVFTTEEAEALKPGIESVIIEYMSLVEGVEDEYERALILFGELVDRCAYGSDENDQNIVSVFTQQVSVCSGYAKALQLLYIRAGIRCAYVTGQITGGERHAWNIAVIDGEPYCMDATWSDARPSADGTEQTKAAFAYFALTTEEMFRSRVQDEDQSLPVCMATDANYYVKIGQYFESYDREAVSAVFTYAALERETKVSVKFSSFEAYEEAKNKLFLENEIFDVLRSAAVRQSELMSTRIVYSVIDDLYIICVELQYA